MLLLSESPDKAYNINQNHAQNMKNTLKKIALTINLLFAIVSASDAATIVFSAGESNSLNEENGTDLAIGNLVRLGVFSLTDSQIQANSGNVAFLNSNFTQIGTARIGDAFGFPGHFSKSVTLDTTSIAGQQMALWVFKSADNSSDLASVNSALQIGIFYMDKALNSQWAVPFQNPPPPATVIDIADLTNPPLNTTLRSGAHVVVGSFPNGTSDQTGAPGFGFQPIEPVPEPSTISFLGIAVLGFLAHRRSR
jgi:PEP-CTERM motif